MRVPSLFGHFSRASLVLRTLQTHTPLPRCQASFTLQRPSCRHCRSFPLNFEPPCFNPLLFVIICHPALCYPSSEKITMAAAAAAAMVALAGSSAVCTPTCASSSQSRLVLKAAPSSSLLVTAAVGSLRPSLLQSTRRRRNSSKVRIRTNARLVNSHSSSSSENLHHDDEKDDVDGIRPDFADSFFLQRALLTTTATLTPFLLSAQDAFAAGGEYGILEGRILSLVHPVVMLGLFGATGYAGFLGWQWRRVRTVQDEITQLKKQEPVAAEGQALDSPVAAQIKELTEVRKALVKGGFKDRHFNWGSILLGSGVLFSVYGAVNTYLRTGKLFPGPHLYGGVGITVLWALAASLVPAMQKGNDTARSLHIALNAINLLLFVSQIPTGWEIVVKVLESTNFP